MKITPFIAILIALLLTAAIYWGANTQPHKPDTAPSAQDMANRPVPTQFDIDSFILASKKQMSQHALEALLNVEQSLKTIKDSSELGPLFDRYAQIWKEHRQFAIAAHYYYMSGKLENSEKNLTFAAQLFLELAKNEHSDALRNWEVSNAIAGFEEVLNKSPDNDSVKINLAECYFGTGEAMKGVALLKEIESKDPENEAVNLLLGQQGLVSGQFDKAKGRFETVIKIDPENLEARLGLAEAMRGLGQKEKAIEILENCKPLINNPEFVKDIDNYIKSFK